MELELQTSDTTKSEIFTELSLTPILFFFCFLFVFIFLISMSINQNLTQTQLKHWNLKKTDLKVHPVSHLGSLKEQQLASWPLHIWPPLVHGYRHGPRCYVIVSWAIQITFPRWWPWLGQPLRRILLLLVSLPPIHLKPGYYRSNKWS